MILAIISFSLVCDLANSLKEEKTLSEIQNYHLEDEQKINAKISIFFLDSKHKAKFKWQQGIDHKIHNWRWYKIYVDEWKDIWLFFFNVKLFLSLLLNLKLSSFKCGKRVENFVHSFVCWLN